MGKASIELGVSLYGYTNRFLEDDGYGFEQMFQELNRLGIKKFEIVGAQMFNHYPTPTTEEIENLLSLCRKYDVEPYSYGGYCDFGKRPDRDLDDNERVGEVVRDLMTAHKLGCKMIRGFGIPGHLYPRVAQMAAFYQIPVCYEIHAPQKPSDPEVQELKKIFEEINSPWVGFVQDFGCFIEKPNPVVFDNYVKMGAKPENLRYIIDNRWSGMSQEEMEDKMREMGGGQPEILAVSTWFGGQSFSPEADIEGFKSIVHLCRYFHGKFYNIGEDCVETTIPYEKILDVIVESGYEGVLMIEYEGRINPEEQIPRHIEMEHRILGELGVLKN